MTRDQEAQNEPSLEASDGEALAGKYLSFELDAEVYGVGILKVREIIGLIDITPLPKTRDYIKGVVNLRGKIIPVIDLRLKFGMPATEYTTETCIVVVDVVDQDDDDVVQMGCIVDTVQEVLDIKIHQVEPTPDLGAGSEADFILGLGKFEEKQKVVTLLDINRVLSSIETSMALGPQE